MAALPARRRTWDTHWVVVRTRASDPEPCGCGAVPVKSDTPLGDGGRKGEAARADGVAESFSACAACWDGWFVSMNGWLLDKPSASRSTASRSGRRDAYLRRRNGYPVWND